ncbi:hypothetical protein [Sphingomonas oryzagri]
MATISHSMRQQWAARVFTQAAQLLVIAEETESSSMRAELAIDASRLVDHAMDILSR